MKSWMMQLWLQNHSEREWPDLSICQRGDACHVTVEEEHPHKESIEKMCSKGFFAKHDYIYVRMPVDEGREGNSASCPSKGTSEVSKTSRDNPVNEGPYATIHHVLSSNVCPEEKEADNCTKSRTLYGKKTRSPCCTPGFVAGYKRGHSDTCDAENFSSISCKATYSKVKEKKCNVLHYALYVRVGPLYACAHYGDNSLDQDLPTNDKPACCISQDGTGLGKYQNKKDDCIIYDKPATNLPGDSERNTKYQNKTRKMHQDDCTIYDKPINNEHNHRRNSTLLDLLHDPCTEVVYV